MIRYIVPSVGSRLKLERHCPNCGRWGGNIHSGIHYRAISDTRITTIAQRRMKCPFCKTTWTLRAEGINHGKQRSDRLIALGVILYMFGLSYRSVAKFLPLLNCVGSKSSIERDVAQASLQAQKLHNCAPRMRVRFAGVKAAIACTCGCAGTGAKTEK